MDKTLTLSFPPYTIAKKINPKNYEIITFRQNLSRFNIVEIIIVNYPCNSLRQLHNHTHSLPLENIYNRAFINVAHLNIIERMHSGHLFSKRRYYWVVFEIVYLFYFYFLHFRKFALKVRFVQKCAEKVLVWRRDYVT